MEQNTPLFEFGIDDMTRMHLAETAKWAKFLSIIGFIMCGLIVILSFFIGSIFSTSLNRYNDYNENTGFAGLGIVMTVLYLAIGVLYFFPCLFLFRFANQMATALNTNEQLTLNRSFQNLKRMFRYMGILTIVVISLYVLVFIFGIIGAAFT
ncbi:MAG TPA: DUF5362 family protein [Chitinophagaceae bacterium]|nr:DUF5362 family protein [Chitinophagaceae bacterium]